MTGRASHRYGKWRDIAASLQPGQRARVFEEQDVRSLQNALRKQGFKGRSIRDRSGFNVEKTERTNA